LQGDIPRQLIHFAAELCRFALPLGVMVIGMIQQHTRR
jgi:surface polysaccharide O-acyltransferase-like enzyme